jgi:hypothetical protein
MTMRLTALDVGIHHLAVVSFRTPRDWSEDLLPEHLEFAELVNVSEMKHERVPRWACQLHHAREISDWLDHVVQEREEYFSPNVERILVERQPPEGIKSVEQYLFKRFRDRVQLVAPIHVQTVLGFRIKNEYDARKSAVVRLCWDFLVRAFPSLANRSPDEITDEERLHDVADAIAIARSFYLDRRNERLAEEGRFQKLAERNLKQNSRRRDPPLRKMRASPYFSPEMDDLRREILSGEPRRKISPDDEDLSETRPTTELVLRKYAPRGSTSLLRPKHSANLGRRIDAPVTTTGGTDANTVDCDESRDQKLENTGEGAPQDRNKDGLLAERNVLLDLLARFPLPTNVRKGAVANSVGFQPA